eukprot:17212-Heterococcus_DN1.PRE.1
MQLLRRSPKLTTKAVLEATAHDLAVLFDAAIDDTYNDLRFSSEKMLAQDIEKALKLLIVFPEFAAKYRKEQLVLESFSLLKQHFGSGGSTP